MSTQIARRRAVTSAAVVLTASTAVLVSSLPAQAAVPAKPTFIGFSLTGDQVPDGGDDNGRGTAVLKLDAKRKTVCYLVHWRKLDGKVEAMHLHKGDAGEVGPHAVDLLMDAKLKGKRGGDADCVDAPRKTIRAIIDDPQDYYLNIHTTEHEDGSIRGQLD